ncbi:Pre-mRNA cleavage complex II protein Clp1-domain-containing protein [Pisolithus croceorrhizus]|nr:Pre-mRNA cleavage complex II protein Clp1-domain-containing protein [Pisolithus croceorrhizus]
MSDISQADTKEWVLEPETEYRFELDPGTSLAIKVCQSNNGQLSRGNAEIFGAELAEGKTYLFGFECKAAVFTWQGCTIVMRQPSTEYVSEETPMGAYANLHMAFEQMRVRALSALHGSPVPDDDHGANPEPPRVLVLGPENSGKTTICKILANYAVRVGQNRCPILVNADPSEGGWIVPGTVSAAVVTSPIATASPVNPLGSAATTGPTVLASNALSPLTYWYGHSEVKRNPLLLDRLIRNLGENVTERHCNDPEERTSGLIVDTSSSFASGSSSADSRHTLVKACVDAFRINVILVVGHEKLNVEMQRLYGNQLTVVKIPKSGGVVDLDHNYRERVQSYQIHAYMYGQKIDPPPGITSAIVAGEAAADLVLAPSSSIVKFGDITIYRIGEETMAPSSALPIGATRTLSEMQPILLDPAVSGSGLLNRVLGVLSPFHPDENERYDEEILDLSVTGFLVITNLDVPNKKMTILSPNQGSIIGKTVIIGSFEWRE